MCLNWLNLSLARVNYILFEKFFCPWFFVTVPHFLSRLNYENFISGHISGWRSTGKHCLLNAPRLMMMSCHGHAFRITHDEVIKWKYFPRNWPLARGIHRSPMISPHKAQWRGALMFSLIFVWINDWVISRETGDLRRYHAHYDVIAMLVILYGNPATRGG